ncbi:nuclear pore complex protein Nup50 [Neodiprion lecontei]|uniref:Nuclear pore complex protein Nup50 n=1 Tax=Neodiprion lecontei TaxID=441921 RepID=A0A6J0B8S2_NEOLC|nr:nuclear pore complex protein Nup50 [Neodiprion lecontei]
MAGKRTATSELNHDNWNDEETREEAGTFSKASKEDLQRRVIKSARRRIVNSGGDDAPKAAFGAFTAFKTAAPAGSSPFSFLANTSNATNTKSSEKTVANKVGSSNGSVNPAANGPESKDSSSLKQESMSKNSDAKHFPTGKEDGKIFKKSTDYYAKLKGLNESVTQWIKSHVDSNPFCILTPIFKDYDKHLKEIEAKHGQETTPTILSPEKTGEKSNLESSPVKSKSNLETGKTESQTKKSVFSNPSVGNAESKSESSIFKNVNVGKSLFGNTETTSEVKSVFGSVSTERNPFLSTSFTAVEDKKKETESDITDQKPTASLSCPPSGPTATFSFGQSSATSTASAGFSFGGGKPFSFGNVAKTTEAEETKEDEEKDDDDEPPKPDFKPITEDDAIYEQRCKVFVKKDGNFADRGVGTLFLKPTPNDKTQLIVRADTSCGNLLLNTILTEGIPMQRMGKNNVMMVLLPTPDSKPPPTPVLLRVKTSEDADALLEKLNKHKK